MPEQISLIATPLVALTLGAMFVLVLVIVCKTIKDMPLFGDTSGWIVATCVALLSVMGLLRFLGAPGPATRAAGAPRTSDDVLNFVLFPYAVLLICALLMLALRVVWPGAKPRHLDAATKNLGVDETRRVKRGTDNRPKACGATTSKGTGGGSSYQDVKEDTKPEQEFRCEPPRLNALKATSVY